MSEWISVRSLLPWLEASPYLVPDDRFVESRRALVDAGFSVYEADLSEVTDEAGLLAVVCRALLVPDVFGCSWDALNDALGEMQAGGAGSVALLLLNSDVVLRSDPHAVIRAAHLLQGFSERAEMAVRSTGFQFEVLHYGQFEGAKR